MLIKLVKIELLLDLLVGLLHLLLLNLAEQLHYFL